MNYCVLDLETSAENIYRKFQNPLVPTNEITAIAKKEKGQEPKVLYRYQGLSRNQKLELSTIDVIIGHNLRFDLLYLWENEDLQNFLRHGGKIWDTLTVEYLLDAQAKYNLHSGQPIYRKLNNLAKKYGGTQKDDLVSEAFASGKTSKEIDKEVLCTYAKYDVVNTELIYLGQLKDVEKKNMSVVVDFYNQHLLLLVEAEYNGFHIDREKLKFTIEEFRLRETKLSNQITDLIKLRIRERHTQILPDSFNINSNQQLSAVLFGGKLLDEVVSVPNPTKDGVLTYKSGKKVGESRVKKIKQEVITEGLGIKPHGIFKLIKGYSVNEEHLELLHKDYVDEELFDLILELRGTQKLLKTYFLALQEALNPYTNCVHPNFHTAGNLQQKKEKASGTSTGRISSDGINAQNMHPEAISLVQSRFVKGNIVSFDYSQLEVVIQGWVTGCASYVNEYVAGTDFHVKRLSYWLGEPYDELLEKCKHDKKYKELRKQAKAISFQKAYGASPQSIAKATGLSEEIVIKIFDQERLEYPEIDMFYKGMVDRLNSNKILYNRLINIRKKDKTGSFTAQGENVAAAYYQMPWGKRYLFEEKACETKRGIWRYWYMPDVQDYPIQGTASDLMAYVGGKVFNYILKHREEIKIINEVHDSFVFDIKDNENFSGHVEHICDIMTKHDNIFSTLPLYVAYGIGKNWKEAKDSEV